MTHVRAFAKHRDAMVGDEREDCDRAYYESHNFYDASASTPHAVWVNRVAGFGFELSPRLVLRRINFGKRDNQAQSSHIAGRQVTDVRFTVCTECGQVKAPDGTLDWPAHWSSCGLKNLPSAEQSHQPMHLVRQLESEALRIVVPVSEHEWSRDCRTFARRCASGCACTSAATPTSSWWTATTSPSLAPRVIVATSSSSTSRRLGRRCSSRTSPSRGARS